MTANIHQGQPAINFGAEINNAQLIVILLHGRGASSESMLPLAEALSLESL
jgi:predicted esterase